MKCHILAFLPRRDVSSFVTFIILDTIFNMAVDLCEAQKARVTLITVALSESFNYVANPSHERRERATC